MAGLLRPPDRMSVPEAAEKYVHLNNPGSYVGPYLNSGCWYMVEPAQMLTAREMNAVVFVGPAQTGKTQSLLLNWIAYSAKVDPMDMILYSPTQANARDFSTRRVDRMHRHSPEIGGMLVKKADADNKFDKHYTNGMILTLSWPTVTELSGKPVGRIGLTDYDRMPDDIGGDGSAFDLAMKRTTVYGSFAMTLAESSPSRPVGDPTWLPKSPHEAPPTTGILALYNRGDRRRRYWPCPFCSEYFEAKFEMLTWEPLPNPVDASETVKLQCPKCGEKIAPVQRADMDLWGLWLKDGQSADRFGNIKGRGERSVIASYWLMGPAANFMPWKTLVMNYLTAMGEFERTGSEEALKKFYNNDLALPYIPRSIQEMRVPEVLKARAEPFPVAEEDTDERVLRHVQAGHDALLPMVPAGVRFLVACVDVQKNLFMVQVFGICPGAPFDMVVVDRFQVVKSNRTDNDGDRSWVKPSAYLEDWHLLHELVMKKQYPLADGSGRRMMIRATACDSGGKEGVTTNAYNFYRALRTDGNGGRFHLVKGDHAPGIPRARITFPDANQKDKLSAARGDVPVLMLNSNALKDTLNGRLDCIEPGKGMVRFPDWLPDNFYAELCSEVRTDKGWEDPRGKARNEAWDLAYYCIGLCVSEILRVEKFDWSNPPGWAKEWDSNDLVVNVSQKERFAQSEAGSYDFAKLASSLA